jgi:2-polyprenyl-6-methoxyphenol hydroxylase-like FAD-dependent oxidoreductase
LEPIMKNRAVLVSGASIAGPALAYWLGRYGFNPTIVEIAPALRTGGNAVDFRGPLHLGMLREMGILEELEKVQTFGTAMRFVDERGDKLMEMPSDFAGGDIEVRRGDLSRILCEAAGDRTEYLFGDSIATMTETPDGVDVTFVSGLRRRFDLVIGGDGVHSMVRRVAFGPESRYVKHLGYYVAGWDVPNEWGLSRDWRAYNVPGRMISVSGDERDPARAAAFVAFASPPLRYDRHDLPAQRRIIREHFGDLGWQTPRLLAELDSAPDLYFDQICRVDIRPWWKGRVALVGDAACGATIGGMGNGTAIVAAYALAGELASAGGDHTVAFPRYERLVADFARGTQKGGDTTGRFLAPKTARGIRMRNALLNQTWFMSLTFKIANSRSTNLDLPDYESLIVSAASRPPRRSARPDR